MRFGAFCVIEFFDAFKFEIRGISESSHIYLSGKVILDLWSSLRRNFL